MLASLHACKLSTLQGVQAAKKAASRDRMDKYRREGHRVDKYRRELHPRTNIGVKRVTNIGVSYTLFPHRHRSRATPAYSKWAGYAESWIHVSGAEDHLSQE